MKCKQCGAEISNLAVMCPYCNSAVEKPAAGNSAPIINNYYNYPGYQPQQEYQQPPIQRQVGGACCPNCGSNQIRFRREETGSTKGKKGRQVYYRTVGLCQSCGYTWAAGQAQSGNSGSKGALFWIIMILFWPIALSIWFMTSNRIQMDRKKRAIILAACWAVFLLIGLFNQNKKVDKNTSLAGPNQVEERNTVYESGEKASTSNSQESTIVENKNTDLRCEVSDFLISIPKGFIKTHDEPFDIRYLGRRNQETNVYERFNVFCLYDDSAEHVQSLFNQLNKDTVEESFSGVFDGAPITVNEYWEDDIDGYPIKAAYMTSEMQGIAMGMLHATLIKDNQFITMEFSFADGISDERYAEFKSTIQTVKSIGSDSVSVTKNVENASVSFSIDNDSLGEYGSYKTINKGMGEDEMTFIEYHIPVGTYIVVNKDTNYVQFSVYSDEYHIIESGYEEPAETFDTFLMKPGDTKEVYIAEGQHIKCNEGKTFLVFTKKD